ncbi:MAG: hypothetical protein Q8Q81_09145 [Oxalobacteraceae bacterium]|nr:hypothetical protein [Oxalobacteraceae bacterium]
MTTLPAPHCTQYGDAGIEWLNSQCFCLSLDAKALHRALESELGAPDLVTLVTERCPYLFSAQPAFVSGAHIARMLEVIRAVEAVIALPAWREQILADAPAIAQAAAGGAQGVFFGYDFHLDDDGVRLIEINTNAGGAMLNAVLARAQRACCPEIEGMVPTLASVDALEQRIVDMFRNEWELSGPVGRTRPLQTIAIVDTAPEQQYLYPEFLLFQRLFQKHGIQAVIADPGALALRDRVLWHGDTAIDLVYNRLTDFLLGAPAHAALRSAYLEHAAVVTPHPQAHALYADKRNLALLCDDRRLQQLGVPVATRAVLVDSIPRTEVVEPANAERLWNQRRQFFFKPSAGFGSRAAYRGDKLTKRVWQEILQGEYVAQAFAAPPQRTIALENTPQVLKFDLRVYVYDGRMQWVAARLYQGQTTNFRTPGGGFAPVYQLPIAIDDKGERT